MGHESRDEDEIEWPLTQHVVGDVHSTTLRVPGVPPITHANRLLGPNRRRSPGISSAAPAKKQPPGQRVPHEMVEEPVADCDELASRLDADGKHFESDPHHGLETLRISRNVRVDSQAGT